MLVLTRQAGQAVTIGEDTVVTVYAAIKPDQAALLQIDTPHRIATDGREYRTPAYLACRHGQIIAIGPDVVVKVHAMGSAGAVCRLGIEAPREVPIVRDDAKRTAPPEPVDDLAPILYLAAPYSHADPEVRRARFAAATRYAGELMKRHGLVVFSPITHSHPIAEAVDLAGDFGTWGKSAMAHLCAAARLRVLQLPGWQFSAGVLAEITTAEARGLPVDYRRPDQLDNPFAT